jgi:hypothetical protein
MSMSAQHHFAPSDHRDRDLYARERVLNSAIIAADIGRGWEEYLEIVDAFYAGDRALLFNFLAPLHVMVEIGGLAIDVRESPIHGDAAHETHSAWSVNLIGVSGRACILNWCTLRRWADSRVVYERHYDHQQSGGPLTGDDLSLNPSLAPLGYGRPS